jgi:hypothetical protein
MTTRISVLAITTSLLALAPLAGCADADESTITTRGGYYYECSNWRCGYNTSEINGKSVQELHLGGQPNDDGVELVGFLPPLGLLLDWKLDVEGDALVARGGLFGNSTLRGNQLIGGTILLRIQSGLIVPVIIAGHDEVESWASDGEPVAAYALVYADLAQPLLQRSICKGTLVDPLQAAVVVLAGERYDLDNKTVIADQDDWITLACAGSAGAKMALLGYGPNAEFEGGGAPASVDQRQATLKMITADYCGTGHSYTVDGTPLLWENQSGTVGLDIQPGDHEAIWTAAGALCLDTPRVVDASEVSCSLPTCDAFTLDDGEWATHAVPQ